MEYGVKQLFVWFAVAHKQPNRSEESILMLIMFRKKKSDLIEHDVIVVLGDRKILRR